jgi:hypothetical protein
MTLSGPALDRFALPLSHKGNLSAGSAFSKTERLRAIAIEVLPALQVKANVGEYFLPEFGRFCRFSTYSLPQLVNGMFAFSHWQKSYKHREARISANSGCADLLPSTIERYLDRATPNDTSVTREKEIGRKSTHKYYQTRINTK